MDAGINFEFVQDNQSLSQFGAVRGLHFQAPPFEQGKLVRVVKGAVLDVVVDIRKNSETYGQHYAIELNEENMLQFWIPPGFAHGFYVQSEQADCFYKCTEYFDPTDSHVIRWDDPTLNISWPLIEGKPIVSPNDVAGCELMQARYFL